MGGGRFAIANQKDGQGGWEWRTFGDGSGFTADLITVGRLMGGKVNFDLDSGTLLIGDSTNDYLLYFDGTDLHLNGDLSAEMINAISLNSSQVIVGSETLEESLINLANKIETIQGGGGNLLLNSNFGTYDSPSAYWWSETITWLLYEARVANWTQHEALIDTWEQFESYGW